MLLLVRDENMVTTFTGSVLVHGVGNPYQKVRAVLVPRYMKLKAK